MVLRWEFSAEARLDERNQRPRGGGVLVAVRVCIGLRLLAWHIVCYDGALCRLNFSSSPWWWWCSVVLCAFVCKVLVFASARDVLSVPCNWGTHSYCAKTRVVIRNYALGS